MGGPPGLNGKGRYVAVCHPPKDGQLPLMGFDHVDAAVESRGEAPHHIVERNEHDERQPIYQEQPHAEALLDSQDKQQDEEKLIRTEKTKPQYRLGRQIHPVNAQAGDQQQATGVHPEDGESVLCRGRRFMRNVTLTPRGLREV